MLRRPGVAAALWLAIGPAHSPAHHSRAHFSADLVELTGQLVGVDWRNPHVLFTLRVTDPSGEDALWRLEGSSIYNLQRVGVTRDLFATGAIIRVSGHASTRRDREMLANTVRFADGSETLLWNNRSLHEDPVAPPDTLAENKGIFRVWSTPRERSRVTHLPFTAAAIAARGAWDPLDNFATRCEQEGMPRIMLNPHPFEFVDRGDEITLRTELYDIERVIHMDRSAPPPGQPSSHLGYSVGTWDGGSLVVETTLIDWPFFDNAGTPQSEQVEILEQFTPSSDQGRLDFHITITDPETFTEPATIRGHWLALGETILRYDCQAR